MVKKKIVVKGEKVQDVGYRLFLLEAAESFGLKGFQARNIKDHVELLVEGAEDRVARFVDYAKTNYPEHARVSEVVVETYRGSVMPVEVFHRSLDTSQLVKIVDVGVSMLQKQDLMLEKQDLMLKKQDLMLEKQDGMLEKQEELIGEIRNLREDLKTYMDERFRKLEMEVARIKEKIGIV
ncbi:MAG: acylphosphatase [Thermoproteota archaeon]